MKKLDKIRMKRFVSLTVMFLLVLSVFRFVWFYSFTTPEHPKVNRGVLDLKGWSHLSDHIVSLEGEWQFLPGVFLYNEITDVSSIVPANEFISVPGTWSFTDKSSDKHGYGTYRMRIKLDPNQEERYSIHFPKIGSAAEVFINGELVYKLGKVAVNKQESQPRNAPFTVHLEIDKLEEIELVIHVTNFDDFLYGGLIASPIFGTEQNIEKSLTIDLAVVLFACAIYLVNALYALIIYIMGFRNRRDNRLLYFSLMIGIVIFITLLTERLLSVWLDMNFESSYRAINVGLIAGGYLMLKLTRGHLPKLLQVRWYGRYVKLMGILGLLSVVAPLRFIIPITHVNCFIALGPCLVAILYAAKTISRLNRDHLFLYFGTLAAVYSLIWLMIIEIFNIQFKSYPFDLLIAVVCYSMYFIKQYFLALDQTEQMMAELQQADRNKDRFLVTVAHEMKNPLHSIMNISQSVIDRESSNLNEQSDRDLKLLVTVGRRMSLILNELLELERGYVKRDAIELKETSVHSIAESVVDMLRLMADAKKLRLVNHIPANFPNVLADEQKLYQILFNLIHNAVKFTYVGEVSIHAVATDKWATISVRDDGVGIEEEYVDRIFEPYKGKQASRVQQEEGLGIGLSICKQLVEIHGGELKVDSTLGEGSVFSFSLRLSPSNQLEETAAGFEAAVDKYQIEVSTELTSPQLSIENQSAGNHQNNIRILAVDDDPVNLKVLESIFSLVPYKVYSVTNGEDALALLNKGNWDLVIADVMMPRMSGYELTARIRERYTMSELPILLLTAYNQEEGIEAGFRVGANDYVAKPMNAIELVSRVKSLIHMKRSTSEKMRMEAAWLQAQIKPHFMINTFHSIAALGRIDLDQMDHLIDELSQYVRLSIDFQNSEGLAPINIELELVRAYLSIQQRRFGNRIQVIWQVDESIDINIPPLTIQPIVENAISHGILKRVSGGRITISIADHGDCVSVTVEDNGLGISKATLDGLLDQAANHKGIGLLNTDRRLKREYGCGLTMKSEEGKGTSVSFRIPKRG
ncbi:ATP-binding protein [Paenibacillus sp. FSL W7-1287]|uniref:ATP-binding protein n=1 Tax=Paenibacillus sp. FSL W7-1287 TaxID=2954538 RepID=UPI0030F6D131